MWKKTVIWLTKIGKTPVKQNYVKRLTYEKKNLKFNKSMKDMLNILKIYYYFLDCTALSVVFSYLFHYLFMHLYICIYAKH